MQLLDAQGFEVVQGKLNNRTSLDSIRKQAEIELGKETDYRFGWLENLPDFYSHLGHNTHKVHLHVGHDLEWEPLNIEDDEEIRVRTFTLEEL